MIGCHTDPNPIIDNGASRSIGGVASAARMCDAMGVQIDLHTYIRL